MIKAVIGTIDNKQVVYYQPTTQDEINANHGRMFWWEYDGKIISNPYTIISMIMDAIAEKKVDDVNSFIQSQGISKIYKAAREYQIHSAIEELQKLKNEYIKYNYPDEAIKHIDETIETFKKMDMFPNEYGIVEGEHD